MAMHLALFILASVQLISSGSLLVIRRNARKRAIRQALEIVNSTKGSQK